MKIQLVSYFQRNKETGETEEIRFNKKGLEEVEIELDDVNILSNDVALRLVSIGKKNPLYKMTYKSYQTLKKEFAKRGMQFRFDNSRK